MSQPEEVNAASVRPSVANAVAESVCLLFRRMMRREIACAVPQMGVARLGDKHVRATVVLSGPLSGTISVLLPESTGVDVIAAFAGRELAFGSAEFRDAAGEIANIVAGATLTQVGTRNVKLGCPKTQIVNANEPGRAVPAGGASNDVFVLTCSLPSGSILVEVAITGARTSAKAA